MADTSANEGAKGGELLYAGVTRAAIVGVRRAPGVRRGAPAPLTLPPRPRRLQHVPNRHGSCAVGLGHTRTGALRAASFFFQRAERKGTKGVGVLQPRGGRALGAAPPRPDPTHATVTRAACATQAASACGCAARERARRVDGDAHLGALLCVCAFVRSRRPQERAKRSQPPRPRWGRCRCVGLGEGIARGVERGRGAPPAKGLPANLNLLPNFGRAAASCARADALQPAGHVNVPHSAFTLTFRATVARMCARGSPSAWARVHVVIFGVVGAAADAPR